MSLPFSAEQLKTNIDHDLAVCKSLLDALKDEQEALKSREVDAVNQILDKKVSLLEALEKSAQLRAAWAQTVANSNDEQGWSAMITELGRSDIKESWQQLKSMYDDVRNQNEINGKLLSKHQNTISRVLDVMRGKTATPKLYNASGYSSNQAHSNHFGEA